MNRNQELQELVIRNFSEPSVLREYAEETRRGLWKSEERLIKKYFSEGSSVLDIGCGMGRTTFPLRRMGYRVLGVDITPAMIKGAAALGNHGLFALMDASCLALRDSSFDNALFSFNGWCQMPGSERRMNAFMEASRVLKKEGFFIFTTHARTLKGYFFLWLKEFLRHYALKPLGFDIRTEFGDIFFERRHLKGMRQYIHIPRLSTVREMLRQAGFEVVLQARRSEIAPEDSSLESEDCTFFVCRKKRS